MSPEYSKQETSGRLARANELISFVRDELENYKIGVLDRVSSNEELRVRFNYKDKTSIISHLRRVDLLSERRSIVLEKEAFKIVPSIEWAWMLGILATGGMVGPKGHISMVSHEDQLIKAFQNTGERLFGINSHPRETGKYKDGKEKISVEFHSKTVADCIGELRHGEWVNTIREKHDWILEDSKYTWGFLEAASERIGELGSWSHGKYRRFLFNTTHLEAANFILEMLVNVGVNEPKISTDLSFKEGIRGVGVYRIEDIKFLATNIHLKSKDMEIKLELCRKLTLPKPENKPDSDEEAIQEWINLRKHLSHSPSATEIYRLKKQGETKFYPHIYISRFGGNLQKKTFSTACLNLEKFVFESEVNACLLGYEEEKGVQVRYVPKAHRLTADWRN